LKKIQIGKQSWYWWIGIAFLLVACIIWIARQNSRPKGSWAKIESADSVQYVSLEEDGTFGLECNSSIRFEVKDGAIRFIEADCPDKICEKEGFLSKIGETAACLPRETIVVIIGGPEGEVDAVAE
jgi:hypothetical protein